MIDLRNQHKNKSAKKPPNIKTREARDNTNQVAAQWLTYPTGIITERAKSYETRTNRGTQREYGSKPFKHSIVKRI